nr:hypothetical protein [Tanacetum cinerariifolium]
VNDVTRLQALVDKKKAVITEATIREALCLDDAEGVDCLPNEEIFAELARMGYGKPSTKLAFYKAFFSSQWNLGRNVDSKFYMYPRFLQLIIRKQVGDLSTYTTKYTSPALTQKVFANMRRVCKGFSRVETPQFKGDVSAAHGEVPTVTEEPPIPSPTPPTPSPQPPQDIPLTSQVQKTPPQSPQVQLPSPEPQPQQATKFPMSLLQEAMDACAALIRRVKHLEFDKVAQALKITKLKRRVKKLERKNKVRVLKLRRLQKDDVVVLEDDKKEDREVADAVKDVEEAKVDECAQDQGKQAESQAEIYKIEMDHANKVLSMQKDKTEPTEVQKVVDVVTTAKLITEVVTAASETVAAASIIITTVEAQVYAATLTVAPARVVDAPSRRRKGVRKSQTEAQARKNMMMYLKNVAGFKMDYFKEMSYDDICPIFEAKFNSNVAFLLKTKEQIEEDENRTLQKLNETTTERSAKKKKLDEKVEELRRHLQIVPNKDDDVYTKATLLARKSNVRETKYTCSDLEKSKNYTWSSKGQRMEATGIMWCADHNFTSTQLILLVERKYPLIIFTLDQMLNAVRLKVEEESEVSLELLRFTRQQHQEGQLE